jgi:DNA-binding MarR family transcriptional regulator
MTANKQVIETFIRWMELSTARSMRNMVQYARESGLSMPQFGLLMHLYHKGSCGVTYFSHQSGVSNAATSQLIGRLVDKQLVAREEDPIDRRTKRLTLTPTGRLLVKNSIAERYRWVGALTSRFSHTESQVISQALPILLRCLNEIDSVEDKTGPRPDEPN